MALFEIWKKTKHPSLAWSPCKTSRLPVRSSLEMMLGTSGTNIQSKKKSVSERTVIFECTVDSANSSKVVYNDGLISSLDAQHTDLGGCPAKSEHLCVDQDVALIFFFL